MKSDTLRSPSSRRSFLKGATAAIGATALVAPYIFTRSARAQTVESSFSGSLTAGDVAILKFLAAAELVEDDLWQQYAELAVNNKRFNAYLKLIDPSLVRYVTDDRDDERSHALFINAFLQSVGEEPVNLDAFRTIPSPTVDGAVQRGRLTNLKELTVDTSWYNRYRSPANLDFGDTFPQLLNITNQPTIPTSNREKGGDVLNAALSAAFHFAAIEQGGSSLYLSLLTKVTNVDVLQILGAIGPVEVYHFSAFHKSLERLFAYNNRRGPNFPNLRKQTNLAQAIFPEPCKFLGANFPLCSVIRPSSTGKAGTVAAATGLVQSGLFKGQPQAFLDAVVALATAADAAVRADGQVATVPPQNGSLQGQAVVEPPRALPL